MNKSIKHVKQWWWENAAITLTTSLVCQLENMLTKKVGAPALVNDLKFRWLALFKASLISSAARITVLRLALKYSKAIRRTKTASQQPIPRSSICRPIVISYKYLVCDIFSYINCLLVISVSEIAFCLQWDNVINWTRTEQSLALRTCNSLSTDALCLLSAIRSILKIFGFSAFCHKVEMWCVGGEWSQKCYSVSL